MLYTVSQDFRFRDEGKSARAGGTVELTDEQAGRYMKKYHGLLAPQRLTTQGAPAAVRSAKPPAKKGGGRK
jgi:hypothetical protein